MDVYSRVIDEDRRLNAKKMDEQFYDTLDKVEAASGKESKLEGDQFLM
ncbi:hypothetical protein [Enterococcus ureasiticus]|nr:hypothetical protein [Enterococcus ureasiticus]